MVDERDINDYQGAWERAARRLMLLDSEGKRVFRFLRQEALRRRV